MDNLLEHVFREVIKFEWEIYRQYKLASKRTARIADEVLRYHPVPESLLPDWQGNKLFKKIKRIENRWHGLILFSPRDRFCQTITLPAKNFPVCRQSYLEAIVFKTKPQSIILNWNGGSETLFPKDGIIWLSFLPIAQLPYTSFEIECQPCQVDLIWHEYTANDIFYGLAHLRLGETFFTTEQGCLYTEKKGFNWLAIYPDVISHLRSDHKEHCRRLRANFDKTKH